LFDRKADGFKSPSEIYVAWECPGKPKPELSKPVLFAPMFDETKELPSTTGSLRNSLLSSELQAEPEKILNDKRQEVGKGGCDVGFERALAAWIMQHRSDWRKHRQPET
jgi:hypothetical protein